MTPILPLCRMLPLLLFTSSAAASVLHRSQDSQSFSFFPRQDDSLLDSSSLNCAASCEMDTCGGACSLLKSITGRSLGESEIFAREFQDFTPPNASSAAEPNGLAKRFFLDGHWPNPYGTHWDITIGTLGRYLARVVRGEDNWYFGNPIKTVDDKTERAVMVQQEFGYDTFQFVTGGQNGCTMVLLVSKRGVWMAHFWEVYSHGTEDTQTIRDQVFKERVLDAIEGNAVPRPTSQKGNNPKVYQAPWGPPLNKALFNQDTDDTMLFLWTPTPVGEKTGERYLARNNEIVKKINDIIGKRPSLARLPYVALDMNDPQQKELMNKSHKGVVVFQYDTDCNGQDQPAWRVFFEDKLRMGLLPKLPQPNGSG